MGGMHPVVAIYATFMNRAFDQVLMDVALHRCGVTFVTDRAGVTGDDGPSHNGMWDMSIFQVVPGLRLAAPRDGARVRELLREAVAVEDAPTIVRLPKGAPPAADIAGDRHRRRVRRTGAPGRPRRARRGRRRHGRDRRRGRRPAHRPGHRRDRRRPALGQAARPRAGAARRRAPAGGQRRGQRPGRGLRVRTSCSCSTTRACARRSGCSASRRSSSRIAKREAILERIGLTAQALARRIVEDVTALDSGRSLVDID